MFCLLILFVYKMNCIYNEVFDVVFPMTTTSEKGYCDFSALDPPEHPPQSAHFMVNASVVIGERNSV